MDSPSVCFLIFKVGGREEEDTGEKALMKESHRQEDQILLLFLQWMCKQRRNFFFFFVSDENTDHSNTRKRQVASRGIRIREMHRRAFPPLCYLFYSITTHHKYIVADLVL